MCVGALGSGDCDDLNSTACQSSREDKDNQEEKLEDHTNTADFLD